jgi:hypothetical protein
MLLFFVCFSTRDDHEKVEGFWEYTVQEYTDARYRRAIRVSRSVFAYLDSKLADTLQDQHFGGRPSISSSKKLAMFLKYIGSKETILDLSQLFGVTESCFIKTRGQVTDAILANLLDTLIQWPSQDEHQDVATYFQDKDDSNFPNVLGSIDGSHIPISTPLINPDMYYNRKKFHSINMLACCREDLRFTDICVGYPGRMHDARVLRNSDLWTTGMAKCRQGQFHVVADAAYPLTQWIMTPYRNTGHLTNAQKLFNTALSKRRVVIEQAFGVFKRRFRRLSVGIDMRNMEDINKLILAACVCHNACILQGDIEEFEEDGDDGMPNRYAMLLENQNQDGQNVVLHVPVNQAVQGRLKRVLLTNNL